MVSLHLRTYSSDSPLIVLSVCILWDSSKKVTREAAFKFVRNQETYETAVPVLLGEMDAEFRVRSVSRYIVQQIIGTCLVQAQDAGFPVSADDNVLR